MYRGRDCHHHRHSLRSVRAILDTHYLSRDPALAESAIRKLEKGEQELPTDLAIRDGVLTMIAMADACRALELSNPAEVSSRLDRTKGYKHC
jgi:hypothetical protein